MIVFELTRNMVNLLDIVNLNSWLSETIDKRFQSQQHLLKIKKIAYQSVNISEVLQSTSYYSCS